MQVTAHRRGFWHPQSYAEQALAVGPDNSDLQLRMVEALWWRVADGSVAVPAKDLRRAEDLATAAWRQRRRWSGSSGQVLTVLLRKNLLAGAYPTMISLATPMPQGQASAQEVGEDSVASLGSVAAFPGRRSYTGDLAAKKVWPWRGIAEWLHNVTNAAFLAFVTTHEKLLVHLHAQRNFMLP
jgi:hypothetical protein